MEVPSDSSLRHVHDVGYVVNPATLNIPEQKGRALFGIKFTGSILDIVIDLLTSEEYLGRGLEALKGVVKILD